MISETTGTAMVTWVGQKRQLNLNPAVDRGSASGLSGCHNHGAAARRVGDPSGGVRDVTQDAIPPSHRIRLLRSLSQQCQEAGDPQVGTACLMLLAVRAAERQCHLPTMLGLPGDRLQQQWTTGDRLRPVIGVGQTDEQTPPGSSPVVVSRKATPAPLVLQLVERVLAIAPIAIQVAQR
jgi:hypothetical protein